jgi:UDP-GlcNAc:undecaprenyl-phosphate/decaprenyl-phosphate GlcNAc-1-phosphate transferase
VTEIDWYSMLVCALLGLVATAAAIPLIQKWAASRHDGSDAREFHHTHKSPVPRFGGLALAFAFLVVGAAITLFFHQDPDKQRIHWRIMVTSLAMFGLGFCDDLRPIGAKKKLIGQILIALAVYKLGLGIDSIKNPFTGHIYNTHWIGPVLTVLWLVATTNLINLIDGIDGLAGGVSLMLMVLLCAMAAMTNGHFLLIAGMAGAVLGFLFFNFPPAKIYMGDGGAYFLGFLIGILSLVHYHKGTIVAALVAPLIVLALPLLDVTVAVLRRGLRGLPIFRPDRRHIHHKLMQSGISHRRVVLILYGIVLVCLLIAFGAFWSEGRMVPLAIGAVCLVMLVAVQSFKFSREWFAVGRVLGNSLELRKETQYALALSHWLELEGEKAAAIENLWADFTFLAGKLGFTRLKLTLEDGTREWQLTPGTQETPWSCVHELNAAGGMKMEFGSDPQRMTGRVFEHLSELSAEAWLKAAARWRAVNSLPVRFDARRAGMARDQHSASTFIPGDAANDPAR